MKKDRPILFSGPMVRAILEGHKTQTRRVIKNVSADVTHWRFIKTCGWNPMFSVDCFTGEALPKPRGKAWCEQCPYGEIGDRLWVREKFAYVDSIEGPAIAYAADGAIRKIMFDGNGEPSGTYAEPVQDIYSGKWKPSIHMPKFASRPELDLVVDRVRVERVQEISEADAYAEGVTECDHPAFHTDRFACSFHDLWDTINAARGFSWDSNPWVWVVEFRRVEK